MLSLLLVAAPVCRGRRRKVHGGSDIGRKVTILSLYIIVYPFRFVNTIGLAYKEMRLLGCLITNSEREIPTAELLREIWAGEDADADTVWMYVSFLQAKLQSVQANVAISGDRGHSYQLREI